MNILKELVNGPFRDEQQFKTAVLKEWRKTKDNFSHFCIENSVVYGMPDVLSMSSHQPSYFTEFKISDKRGVIKFRKTQPLFYKRHAHLNIAIYAWDRRNNWIVVIEPSTIIKNKSLLFKLPD